MSMPSHVQPTLLWMYPATLSPTLRHGNPPSQRTVLGIFDYLCFHDLLLCLPLIFDFCSQQTLANLSDMNLLNAPSPNNTSFVQHENVTNGQLAIVDLFNGKRAMKLRQIIMMMMMMMMNDDGNG